MQARLVASAPLTPPTIATIVATAQEAWPRNRGRWSVPIMETTRPLEATATSKSSPTKSSPTTTWTLEFAAENKTLFAMTLIGMICCVAFLCYHATRSSSRLPLWKNTNKVKPPTDAKMEFINQLTALHSAPDFWEQAHNMLRATRTCCEKGRAANIA